MPREDTQFTPGRSGNPAGRPRGARSARSAVRRALEAVDPIDPSRTRMEAWAESLVADAATIEDRLAVLKWLEGASPPPEPETPPVTLVDVARRMAERFGDGSPTTPARACGE